MKKVINGIEIILGVAFLCLAAAVFGWFLGMIVTGIVGLFL